VTTLRKTRSSSVGSIEPMRPGFGRGLTHSETAFVSNRKLFDFRRLRVLFVGSGFDPALNLEPLLQLGHETSKVFVASIQDLP
jgi:hypothetical protein